MRATHALDLVRGYTHTYPRTADKYTAVEFAAYDRVRNERRVIVIITGIFGKRTEVFIFYPLFIKVID